MSRSLRDVASVVCANHVQPQVVTPEVYERERRYERDHDLIKAVVDAVYVAIVHDSKLLTDADMSQPVVQRSKKLQRTTGWLGRLRVLVADSDPTEEPGSEPMYLLRMLSPVNNETYMNVPAPVIRSVGGFPGTRLTAEQMVERLTRLLLTQPCLRRYNPSGVPTSVCLRWEPEALDRKVQPSNYSGADRVQRGGALGLG